jgi:iron complex transport system ATP-binding protein
MSVHVQEVNRLEARAITVQRGRRTVLRQISMALNQGEVLSLLGANGAGKSSFLSALASEFRLNPALHADDALRLNGQGFGALSVRAQARSRTVLPQKPGLAFDLDVTEVAAMGAYPFPELSAPEVQELVDRVLSLADIAHLAQRRYLELSGGEQQRVQFARVLLQLLAGRRADPGGRYLLLDEPTASLDPLHQQSLLQTVVELTRSERIGALVILHDINLAARYSDRIALLSDGGLLVCDTPGKALTAENLRQVYGINAHIMPHPQCPERPLVVL